MNSFDKKVVLITCFITSYQCLLQEYLALENVYFFEDGVKYSLQSGNLHSSTLETIDGCDNFGSYSMNRTFLSSENGQLHVEARSKKYLADDIIVSELFFPTGLQNCSTGDTSKLAVAVGSIPLFKPSNLSFWAQGGRMFGDINRILGNWSSEGDVSKISSGIDSGTLTLFQKLSALLVSTVNQFTISQMFYDIKNKRVHWGAMGNLSEIPPETKLQWIFVRSNGVRNAVTKWGNYLCNIYEKQWSKNQFISNYLGYWTDNGGFYYYNSHHYATTINMIVAHYKRINLPIRYIQYDSWWYYKDPGRNYGGVINWTAIPEVFPKNMSRLNRQIRLPVVAHNRHWSSKTQYSKENGGQFNFIVEKAFSIPNDKQFWDFLFSSAKLWGLHTYEQDWMNVQVESMSATQSDFNLVYDWLYQMDKSAAEHDINILYCMTLCNQALNSILLSSISLIRVSDDYQPGNEQWRIGITSMLSWAIKLVPFKDIFWTTNYQPGNIYNKSELYPQLEAAVASLSSGPVALSDRIGFENTSLIMRCCNSDGLLLKPDQPAFAIDDQLLANANSQTSTSAKGIGPTGEVWTTSSTHNNFVFGIIFAANLFDSYSLSIKETHLNLDHTTMAIDLRKGKNLSEFNENVELILESCSKENFCLFYTSPRLLGNSYTTGLYIFGELDKWIPMSKERVKSIEVQSSEVITTIKGGINEHVEMHALWKTKWKTISCRLGKNGIGYIYWVKGICI